MNPASARVRPRARLSRNLSTEYMARTVDRGHFCLCIGFGDPIFGYGLCKRYFFLAVGDTYYGGSPEPRACIGIGIGEPKILLFGSLASRETREETERRRKVSSRRRRRRRRKWGRRVARGFLPPSFSDLEERLLWAIRVTHVAIRLCGYHTTLGQCLPFSTLSGDCGDR